MDKLQFDFSKFYDKAKKYSKKVVFKGVTINLPFISFDFVVNSKEKEIAREIIIQLRDKRVLNSKECCEGCINNSLNSLMEIRKFLVDKQVEIGDIDSPLFLLIDFSIYGIRLFLSYTESFQPNINKNEYFEALAIIREHLLRTLDQIRIIAKLPKEFGFKYEFSPNWDKSMYIMVPFIRTTKLKI